MHPALREVDHRPWPLPASNWTWRQSWLDLAFIHYRVERESVAALLPKGVRLQEFDGSAWAGLVPFLMAGVMRRPWPDLPRFSSFPELNLRTYVEVGGKPGVWFFSLDADSWPVVFGGRHLYDLPYHSARIQLERAHGEYSFRSVRRAGKIGFAARYRPVGAVFLAQPGTFEHWATERYCLYSSSKKRGLARVEVHHGPWPLQRAEVAVEECTVLSSAGVATNEENPTCLFSTGVEVVSYARENAAGEFSVSK